MRLEVDFNALEAVASQFKSKRDFNVDFNDEAPIEPIDIQLGKGIEIQLTDLDSVDGLLAYKGRHVILYIRDHGGRLDDALRDPELGKKFHVADCETLDSMRSQGRFERYVVTQSISGDFEISGRSHGTGRLASGSTRLKVCKNCLKKLNYDSFALSSHGERSRKRDAFSLLTFFETYSTRFRELPRGLASKEDASGYSSNWKDTSRRLREESNNCCDGCRICLREHMDLLHVHHINGVKNDDRRENLRVLCKDCHRKEPMHGHIFVSRREMSIISRLRTLHGVKPQSWEDAIRLADLAVRPTLEVARHQRWDVPEFAVEVVDASGLTARFDVAWPASKRAIVHEHLQPVPQDWRVDTAGQLLSELSASL